MCDREFVVQIMLAILPGICCSDHACHDLVDCDLSYMGFVYKMCVEVVLVIVAPKRGGCKRRM